MSHSGKTMTFATNVVPQEDDLYNLGLGGTDPLRWKIFGNLTGNASTATEWASAQTVYVTLGTASTTTTLQGGSSTAQTIGVDGTLKIGNGGTGTSTAPTPYGVIYAASDTQYTSTAKGATNAILTASGTDQAPAWTAAATLSSQIGSSSNDLKQTTLTLGNAISKTTAGNSEGILRLYSELAGAHLIKGKASSSSYTHTLPNSTGVLVSLSDATAKGSATKPVYVPNTGIIKECNLYAGGTAVTLNGTNKSATVASFYAPTTYGTAGYILKANGENEAPFWVEKVSYNNLPTNDNFILTEGSGSTNPPATAQATIPSNYALNRKIFYSQDTPSVTDADLGMFWFQPASFTMEDLKCLIVGVVATNTTSVTINNDDITTDMVVVKCVLSNPSAQTGDLTWTTTGKDPEDPNSRGNIVVNGTINGTTSMTFYLIHAQ